MTNCPNLPLPPVTTIFFILLASSSRDYGQTFGILCSFAAGRRASGERSRQEGKKQRNRTSRHSQAVCLSFRYQKALQFSDERRCQFIETFECLGRCRPVDRIDF